METLLRSNSVKNLMNYFEKHDTRNVADDAVFTNMSSGEEHIGRGAVEKLIHYMYHVAFDATAVIRKAVITDDNALLEANFVGKHIGEFAGIPPTNKEVDVPFCVSYDLNDEGKIQKARIYMLGDVMLQQLKD